MADPHLRRQDRLLIEQVRQRLARLHRNHEGKRVEEVHQLLRFEQPLAQLQERMRRYAAFDESHEPHARPRTSGRFGPRTPSPHARHLRAVLPESWLDRQRKAIQHAQRETRALVARDLVLLTRTSALIAQSVALIRSSR